MREKFPQIDFNIRIIRTKGDKLTDVHLARFGSKGIFVKEIESALLAEEIDIAVHSMKDVPTELPPGLIIAAVPERADARDAIISKGGVGVGALPRGALVGTSSLRRRAQLLHYRPDLSFVNLRGNLDTRLRKLYQAKLEAIVLAAAGVERLGWGAKISEKIPSQICLPAVGQGALAIEARQDDQGAIGAVASLNELETMYAVTAERAMLKALGGGCQVPIGAWGGIMDGRLTIEGVMVSDDGQKLIRSKVEGNPRDAEALGATLAENLLRDGAREILDETIRIGN